MSPRRQRKLINLGLDRVWGLIGSFNCDTGRGVMRYGRYKLAFSARDVRNYPAGTDISGFKAHFSVLENKRRIPKRAVDIILPSLSYRRYPPNPDDLDEEDLVTARPVGMEAGAQEEKPAPVELSNEQRIALALFGPIIKLVSLSPDGQYWFLDEQQKSHNLLYVLSAETVEVERAVEELEHLMNDPKARENDFQNFFERHPDFILNDEYREAHPHLVLENAEGDCLIPDFILQPVNQRALCDLLELKLPSVEVFVMKKNRPRYSAAVYEAAAQLREYSRYFDEETHRTKFRDKYPLLNVYRPRMFVIIGRQGAESPTIARAVEAEMPDIYLRTYDDVLKRAKWKLGRMKVRGLTNN
jgi:hypothetical protein